jgi:arylsulfatase
MRKQRTETIFIILSGLAFLAGGLAPTACRRGDELPNAIFILLDAARSDRFGCYGYGKDTSPRIDALAAEGAVCLHNFSNGTYTLESVPTYFYSRYYIKSLFPADPRIPLQEPENLFRAIDPEAVSMAGLFKAAGYRTVLFSSHPWLVRGYELVEDFDEFYQVKDRHYPHATAEPVFGEVERWLATRPPEPFFIYIHLMDPHTPRVRREETMLFADPAYDYRGQFDRHGNPVGEYLGPDGAWRVPEDLDREDLDYLDALYDGEIRYSDRCLGDFVDILQERKLYDRTLMVIGSDHGEHLGEHGYSQHGGKPYESVIKAPLIMRLPGRIPAGTRIDLITENVDILPTMAGVLGIPAPPGKRFDGADIFRMSPESEAARWALSPQFLRSREHKLIVDRETGERFLYDLEADPGETRDLAPIREDLARELQSTMERLLSRSRERYEKSMIEALPGLPFAVSARSFNLESSSPRRELKKFVHPWEDPEIISRAESEPAWIHNIPPGRDFILGFSQPGLEPLSLNFPVPSGEYRVSLYSPGAPDIRGYPGSVFEIRLGGAETGRSFLVNTGRPAAPHQVDLGVVKIEDQKFTAAVVPGSEPSWILLRYFSFEPVLPGVKTGPAAGEDADERRKRLEALGYMQ